MRVLVAFFIISFLFSCKNEQKTKHLHEINTMEQDLDSLSSVANDTTQQRPGRLSMNVEETIQKVKNNYLPDTINYSVAKMMNNYKEIKKAVMSNSGNLAKVKQSIPEVRQKVKDLKHDIENGVGERERYEEYINFEKKKIADIKDVLNYYLETRNKFYNRYDSLHPIVTNFADSLLNAKKN